MDLSSFFFLQPSSLTSTFVDDTLFSSVYFQLCCQKLGVQPSVDISQEYVHEKMGHISLQRGCRVKLMLFFDSFYPFYSVQNPKPWKGPDIIKANLTMSYSNVKILYKCTWKLISQISLNHVINHSKRVLWYMSLAQEIMNIQNSVTAGIYQ